MDNRSQELEKRTREFAVSVIVFCKKHQNFSVYTPIMNQLIRAVTSIGANYAEANGASSRTDFRNKIFICKKECNETEYWLRIIQESGVEFKEEIELLLREGHQLTLIFSKIASTLNNK